MMEMELLPEDLKSEFGRYLRKRFSWFGKLQAMPRKGTRREQQLMEATFEWWVQLSENDLYRALFQMERHPRARPKGIDNLRRVWQRVRAAPLPADLAIDFERYMYKHLWWFGQGPRPRPGTERYRQIEAAIEEWAATLSPEDQRRANEWGQQEEVQ